METRTPPRDSAKAKDSDARDPKDELFSLQQKARKDAGLKNGRVFTDWASI